MKNITDLVKGSIRIYEGQMVAFPQFKTEDRIHIKDMTPKFDGTYCTNNSTVAFVWEEMLYVTPYTKEVVSILREAGFKFDYFGVPFSNWDYPVYEKEQWNGLLEAAKKQRELELQEECKEVSSEKGIGQISEASLANCLKIPGKGFKTWHPQQFEGFVSPSISGCLDCSAIEKLGKYATNNGKVVFIYYDGSTYVTKGYGIVKELEAAGYQKMHFFVPLSNGEEIQDPDLQKRWESITK